MKWTAEAIAMLRDYGGKVEIRDRELWKAAEAAAKEYPEEIKLIPSRELPPQKEADRDLLAGRIPFGGIVATSRGIEILKGENQNED